MFKAERCRKGQQTHQMFLSHQQLSSQKLKDKKEKIEKSNNFYKYILLLQITSHGEYYVSEKRTISIPYDPYL